jgi:glucosamine-6-phosphate deaminase
MDNARFFDGDIDAVPTHCLTQGLGTIMEARHIVLVATGRAKAEAVHHLVEGPVSAMWPATVLQHHPHVTVLLDEAAAQRLQLADYYRETYASKPGWQGI